MENGSEIREVNIITTMSLESYRRRCVRCQQNKHRILSYSMLRHAKASGGEMTRALEFGCWGSQGPHYRYPNIPTQDGFKKKQW